LNWSNKGIHDICFFITYIIPPPHGLFLPEGKSFLDFALLGKKRTADQGWSAVLARAGSYFS
jgi:hypothetical protein